MSCLDKIGKTATNTCKVTVCKTNKMAKRAKLKMHINECKEEIEDIYNKIGKKVYEKHVREENIDIKQDLKEECRKIDRYSKEIDSSIERILMLKDMKKCPNCFSEIMIQYNFCPNCGKKQYNIKPREEKIIEQLDEADIDDTNEKEAEIVKNEKEEFLENNE